MRLVPILALVAGLAACGDRLTDPDDPPPPGPVDWSQPQLFVRHLLPAEDVPAGALPDTLRFHGFPAGGPPGGIVTWAQAGGPQPADPRTREYRFSVARRSASSVQLETCPLGLYCITNLPVVGVLAGNQLHFEQWPGQRYDRKAYR